MLFNSYLFIFVFLPITFILFYAIGARSNRWARFFLLLASFVFYGYWNPSYVPLLLVSIVVNFTLGTYLSNEARRGRKVWLTVGIAFNVGLIAYFKYYDFFIDNVNVLFGLDLPMKELLLPLAISFYTFQQIAYLVDSYRLETKGYDLFRYGLFVSFFPQLIAGPIVHHGHVMPQFERESTYRMQAKSIASGLFIFSLGLFKKVGIADALARYASEGYRLVDRLTVLDSWLTTTAYTFQIYFDFSGYSDMAIGLGLLFNIRLPQNFNSPFQAVSIQDFWRRWHMTLSQFLTKYIYFPLGGSRKGVSRTYVNIFLVFLISGIWHGAAWTFVVWGVLHGVASIIYRIWSKGPIRLPKWAAWFVTFSFIHLSFVMFRAKSVADALAVYGAMFGWNGYDSLDVVASMNRNPVGYAMESPFLFVLLFGTAIGVSFFASNSIDWLRREKRSIGWAVGTAVLFVYAVGHLQQVSEFLYFNF